MQRLTGDALNLTLDVAGTTFAFQDADTKDDDVGSIRRWNDSGLSWGAGNTETLKLTAADTNNNNAAGVLTISGNTQVGQTLTAVTTGITDPDGLTNPTFTYQWIRVNGTDADITGATSSTYVLQAADLGKTIKVQVTFDDDDGNTESLTSAETGTVGAAPVNAAPSFSSSSTFNAEENQTTVGTVMATDTDSQDSVTGYALTGGVDQAQFSITSPGGVLTFKLAPDYESPQDVLSTSPSNAAENNEYVLVVTATSGAGGRALTTDQTITVTVTNVDEDPAGKPTISGNEQVGQTLTASTNTITDPDGLTKVSYTYQWIRVNGTDADITGAMSSTYVLQAADLGKTIKVKAGFTDDGGYTESLTSAATGTVAAATGGAGGDTGGGTGGGGGDTGDGTGGGSPAPTLLTLRAAPAPAEGGNPVTVTATLDNPAPADGTTVTLTTGGTATLDTDYTLSSTTITLAEGETAGTVTITVTDDAEDDDGETIVIDAASTTPALTAAALTLTIEDNDGPAPTLLTLSAAPAPIEGGEPVTVTATLDNPAPADGLTVTLTTGGTATLDTDYTLSSTTITLAAGETAGTATITVTDDAEDDDAETIVIAAESTTPALTAEPLTLTIEDNDVPEPVPALPLLGQLLLALGLTGAGARLLSRRLRVPPAA